MPITDTCKARQSGNHGSSQPDNRAAAPTESAAKSSKERQESSIRFVSPLKKSPSIKEVMAEPAKKDPQPAEPQKETVAEQPVNEASKEESPVAEAPVAEPSTPEVKEEKQEETPVAEEIVYEEENDDDNNLGDLNDAEDDDNGEEEPVDSQYIPTPSAAPAVVVDDYTQHWNTMLDIVFANHPSVQSPLRDMPPEIVDNVMKIKVSGAIQQKTLEQKKRDMLEYFRNNYREDIDDIEVEVDAKVETKKVIYGNEDKLNYQRQQNRDMDDFLKKLNLKLV